MDWILNRLACGTFDEAQMLVADGLFDRVLNLSERLSDTVLPCLHLPMPDEVFLDTALWDRQIEALAMLLHRSRRAVFVHCRLGISRAPALCAAYLTACGIAHHPDEALDIVRRARPQTAIHPETWRGVRAWWIGKEPGRTL